MRKNLLFLFIILLIRIVSYGQTSEIDGIKASIPKITDSLRYVDALNRLGMLFYERDIDSTFYYTIKARDIADRLDYHQGKADALNNLGVLFDIKGNQQLALRYYNEAYSEYTTLEDTSNRVQTLMNIAMVYKETGKNERSLEYHKLAINLGKGLKKDSIMSLVIYNYLLQFPEHFNHDLTRIYINKAKSIAKKYKDTRVLLAIDQLVADNLFTNGKQAEGIALLKSTANAAIDKKLFYTSMDILIDAGDKLATSDAKEAAAYYQMGLEISKNNKYLIYSELIARKLFDFYTAQGDVLKAASYARLLVDLHDEHEKLNSNSSVDYLDYALKEREIKSLTLSSQYHKILLGLSIFAFLLAVLIIISIRRNLKKISWLNKQITDQNAQMRSTLKALEQSHEDNTKMMKIVAHDLRNPIGGIYSLAELMLDEPQRTNDDRAMLELIKTSGAHSLELVNNLLNTHLGEEDLKKEPVELSEMLQYCVSLLLNKAEAKGQHINLQAEPFTLPASPEKLWRVMSNLITNAIKFSPSGANIEVKMESLQNGVRISVKDFGIGIPADVQDKIFDMFSEAKRPGTAGEQPFGLGLAISKQIVEAHSGKIWFESTNKGTSFFVDLPAGV